MWSIVLIAEAELEFRGLPDDLQGRFLYVGPLLKTKCQAKVGMPRVRPLGEKLWEMRLTGKDGIARAIYFAASGRRFVVLRVFEKKTEKTPRREIEIARWRMENFHD